VDHPLDAGLVDRTDVDLDGSERRMTGNGRGEHISGGRE